MIISRAVICLQEAATFKAMGLYWVPEILLNNAAVYMVEEYLSKKSLGQAA